MLLKTSHCEDLIYENVLCGFYWAYHGLLLTLGSSAIGPISQMRHQELK